jgi:acetoin utilization protein AcuB
MTAAEIMTPRPFTVNERTTVDEALRLMSEKEIRHLPVVREGDSDEVVGMISDRDLRSLGLSLSLDQLALDTLRARLRLRVTELMSGDVVSVEPEAELDEIIDLLLEEKISAVPVIEGETCQLLGIVSYVDVLRALKDSVNADH